MVGVGPAGKSGGFILFPPAGDEIDPAVDFISIDSPMAKALLRRSEGDEVVVSRPNGTTAFVVTSITYEE